MSARNADLSGQPGPFGANGIFDHLDHQGLALKDLLLDGNQGLCASRHLRRLPLRLPVPHIGHMQESGTFKADVNEGRLHAWQHTGDFAQVNVAHQSTL